MFYCGYAGALHDLEARCEHSVVQRAFLQLYILNHAFAIDIPHPNSAFRNSYLEDATGLWTLMRRRYMVFLRKLNLQYSEDSRFPICDSSVQDYYSAVWLVC